MTNLNSEELKDISEILFKHLDLNQKEYFESTKNDKNTDQVITLIILSF